MKSFVKRLWGFVKMLWCMVVVGHRPLRLPEDPDSVGISFVESNKVPTIQLCFQDRKWNIECCTRCSTVYLDETS